MIPRLKEKYKKVIQPYLKTKFGLKNWPKEKLVQLDPFGLIQRKSVWSKKRKKTAENIGKNSRTKKHKLIRFFFC